MKFKDIIKVLDTRSLLIVVEHADGECGLETIHTRLTPNADQRLAAHGEGEVLNIRPTEIQWRFAPTMTLEVTLSEA